MKKCGSCDRLVKNSYDKCFDCNNAKCQKDGSESEAETPYKKETIPKCVRNALWINYFKESRTGLCQCCKREVISIGNFHAGHIIAEANGGRTALDNLVPICMLCNTSSGKMNMQAFIEKYNLHFGL